MTTNDMNPADQLIQARLLKPGEVAAALNVSRSFAYHLLQTGVIPVVRIGKVCRVRPQDLTAYIDSNLDQRINFR